MQAEDFRLSCEKLTGEPITADRRLGLAVSGGPDSLAMLLLAHEAFPDAIEAVTIDHGLRPEAADEAAFVAETCSGLGVPHRTLTPASPIEGNLQSEARRARYALLEGWREENGLGWIATAHHADDQLETIMMRLLRGSGIDGLSAIRPVNGKVIRPLLSCRKTDLEAVVEKAGLTPIRDPSNEDDAFDRARIRKALAEIPDIDPDRIARSAAALGATRDALQWTAEREWERRARKYGTDIWHVDMDGLPEEIRRRLTIQAIDAIRSRLNSEDGWRADKLDGVMETARAEGSATIAGVLVEPGEDWRFSPAPPRKTG